MRNCYLDTETVGFHGMAVLLQYAYDDEPIELYDLWNNPVSETLELISEISECNVIGFNLAFDWFHLCKIQTVFSQLRPDDIPATMIDHIGDIEASARTGDCLKPASAWDLMLHARKGPYQSLMDRKDIRVRRVPAVLAASLAEELETRIVLDDIYFTKRKDQFAPKWKVMDIVKNGVVDTEFRDVVLKFHASGGLKTLAMHALGVESDKILLFTEIGVPKQHLPVEFGWASFATAIGSKTDWKGSWPDVIKYHIDYWAYSSLGRQYALADVDYTRRLAYYFAAQADGSTTPRDAANTGRVTEAAVLRCSGDDDSTLACMVGAVRWHGFKIDIEAIRRQRAVALQKSKSAPKDPARVKAWLMPVLDEVEQLALMDDQGKITTKRVILEHIEKWMDDSGNQHPAAKRAAAVLTARKAKKEMEVYDKLILAGRFHASFVVIGTLSSRMAGSDGLNPQGINSKKEVRRCFPLADTGFGLCGGDFESFEVVLADAVYDDPGLRRELTTVIPCDWCKGEAGCKKCDGAGEYTRKIHALFAMKLFPGKTYDDIVASKGTDFDMYSKGKQGVFSQIYGGDENTVQQKLGIDIEVATEACLGFQKDYAGVGRARRRTFDDFCSMRQPAGIGSKVEWHEPKDYIESFLGFRRYFTLENQICHALFKLAEKPPSSWRLISRIKVVRRDREQSASGALMSALFAAAFAVQARNMRAAANHEIQSPGAQITKAVQRSIWGVQPAGVGPWIVVPMNVHDEIMVPTKPGYEAAVAEAVHDTVESYRDKVPLIAIDWSEKLTSWAEK